MIALILILGTSLGCSKDKKKDNPQVKVDCVITLDVTGMTCGGGCPPRIEEALNRVEGVATSKASYEQGNAIVQCGGSLCKTDGFKPLVEAVKASGYDASFASIVATPSP